MRPAAFVAAFIIAFAFVLQADIINLNATGEMSGKIQGWYDSVSIAAYDSDSAYTSVSGTSLYTEFDNSTYLGPVNTVTLHIFHSATGSTAGDTLEYNLSNDGGTNWFSAVDTFDAFSEALILDAPVMTDAETEYTLEISPIYSAWDWNKVNNLGMVIRAMGTTFTQAKINYVYLAVDYTAESPTITPTFTDTPTETPTWTSSPDYSATDTPSITDTPTGTPTPTGSATVTVTGTDTPSITATDSGTPTDTFTATYTATDTSTPSATCTGTGTDTNSATPTGTTTISPTPTDTGTVTATPTDSPVSSATDTPSVTGTFTATGTSTATFTGTVTPTSTDTGTQTMTDTKTFTPTATQTVTRTNTNSPVNTNTFTQTSTPTNTATPSRTVSDTPTATGTGTITQTNTITPTFTDSPVATNTPFGEGSAIINPGFAAAGTSGNTMTIVYTAGATTWVNGVLKVIIPSGWSAPSANTVDPGYFRVTVSGGSSSGSSKSGQTITVNINSLTAFSGTITVVYGSKASGGPGATCQPLPGTPVFTVESNPTGAVTYPITILPQVTVTNPTATATYTYSNTFTSTITQTHTVSPTYTASPTPITGEGSAAIIPAGAVAWSTGNTFSIEYTAGPSNWAASPGFGSMKISIPAGWPAPVTTSSAQGYYTVVLTGGTLAGKSSSGQDIRVSASDVLAGQKIIVTYGNRAGGGPGITAPAGGTHIFRVEAATSGLTTHPIAVFPVVNLSTPTSTPTASVTMTYTSTPNSTPVPPPAFASQQSGGNTTLSWTSGANIDYYKIYLATGPSGRLYSFPTGWTLVATVVPTPGTSSYSDASNPQTYCFYRVSAVNGAGESQPAAMASRIKYVFNYNAGSQNSYRIGLPFNSPYGTASAIVTSIEGNPVTASRINNIAFWDPSQQSYIARSYINGSWRAPDWTVDAGTLSSNAIFVNVVSAFTWNVTGTDKSAPLFFKYYPGKQNMQERMIPYASAYQKASDIVRDIEGNTATANRINLIAVFNPAMQSYTAYVHNGTIWPAPSNFNVVPGDIIQIRLSGTTSEFTWTPKMAGTPIP